MYKKIVTTITEEQFDEMPKETLHNEKLKQLYNPSWVQLYLSRNVWEDHLWFIREISSALVNGLDENVADVSRLYDSAKTIGWAAQPYYGTAVAEKLSVMIEAIDLSLIDIITSMKQSKPYDTIKTQLDRQIADLSSYMDEISFQAWNAQSISVYLTHLTGDIISSVNAKFNKDWVKDNSLGDTLRRTTLSIADTFSRGLIERKSSQFFRNA